MTVPIQVLMEEHRMILKGLECLEKLLEKLSQGEIPKDLWESLLEFFREFADKTHHSKEEDLLFSRMVERGFPKEGGPIHCMLEEHRLGRAHVTAMLEALSKDQDIVSPLEHHGRAFFELLSDHIHKEDHILFPMASDYLDSQDWSFLQKEFQKVEERFGKRHHKYWDKLAQVANQLGIPMVEKSQCATISKEYGL